MPEEINLLSDNKEEDNKEAPDLSSLEIKDDDKKKQSNLVTFLLLAAIVAVGAIGAGFWYLQNILPKLKQQKFVPLESITAAPEPTDDQVCIQVITPARNPVTGEVRDFPTPCDVPEGWENIQ